MKNLKHKFLCSLCKGDYFLRDFPGIPKVLEVWSSMSSTPGRHVGDAPSTSDIKVGKKKTTIKFPSMLCEGDHYSNLFPHMDEASTLLEKPQLPTGYFNISPNPSLVDRMVNPVPSSVNTVDQVVNLVSSSIEPLIKVADLVPSSINPTFYLESETHMTDPVPSLVSPTLHLKSAKVVSPNTSSVNPTPHMKSANVVNPIPSSIDPTLPLESKPDFSHVFLVDTGSNMSGGIPPPAKTPPSNEAILFDWGVITGPCLPSHIPFNIPVQGCGQDVHHTLIDEGSSVSIFSSISWKDLGYPKLVSVT
jgi:hypothetical protein